MGDTQCIQGGQCVDVVQDEHLTDCARSKLYVSKGYVALLLHNVPLPHQMFLYLCEVLQLHQQVHALHSVW